MKHAQQTGFSIILAMGIVLLLSLIGLYLMEYMIPFSRSVKGIENASQAYYESYAGVEDAALKVYSGSLGSDYTKVFLGTQDYGYNFFGSGTSIPAPGEGNAPESPNYSRLSQSEPISLNIGNGRFNATGERIDLYLRVPDGGSFALPLSDEIVLLQLSGPSGSLSSASGTLLTKADVNDSAINIFSETGTPLTGVNRTFMQYYADLGCHNVGTDCVLRASVIRPLISNAGNARIPYLEYRVESSKPIPYQNPLVSSQGRSFGFSKTLEVFIPQQTTSSAFDFTVLQ